MAFRWTPRRDRELTENMRDGFTMRECGNMLGCTREEAAERWRELCAARSKPSIDVARVPRPSFVARPDRINISKAPSAMEQRAAAWAKRGD